MEKAQEFIIAIKYKDVLAEAEATAKYSDMSMNVKLKEYKNLCKTLFKNGSRNDFEKAVIASKFFKAKELIDINGIRRN